ncbi:MAG: hypothetical protein AAFN78_15035 [Pseudomonadota bacterium]
MQIFKQGALFLCLAALLLTPVRSNALSVDGLLDGCAQAGAPCKDLPWAQAYIGGALDLIAMLDEETDYLGEVYCKSPDVLFDVPGIFSFIEKNRKGNGDKNAMMLVIRFFEEYGGCGRAK